MKLNYTIVRDNENQKVLKDNSMIILEEIINHYNECDGDFEQFAKDIIIVLESWFTVGY